MDSLQLQNSESLPGSLPPAGVHHSGSGGNVDRSSQLFSLGPQLRPGGQSVFGKDSTLLQTDQPGPAGVLRPRSAAARKC